MIANAEGDTGASRRYNGWGCRSNGGIRTIGRRGPSSGTWALWLAVDDLSAWVWRSAGGLDLAIRDLSDNSSGGLDLAVRDLSDWSGSRRWGLDLSVGDLSDAASSLGLAVGDLADGSRCSRAGWLTVWLD